MKILEKQKIALDWFKKNYIICDECPKRFDFTCSGADSERCNAYEQAIIALTVIQRIAESKGKN
jgi:hypothetical protein